MALKKDMVQASALQKHGQVLGLSFSTYTQNTDYGCMRCLWNTEPAATCVETCEDAGILTIVTGTVGLRQASTALQFLLGNYAQAKVSSLYNYESQQWDSIPLPHTPNCVYCTQPPHTP